MFGGTIDRPDTDTPRDSTHQSLFHSSVPLTRTVSDQHSLLDLSKGQSHSEHHSPGPANQVTRRSRAQSINEVASTKIKHLSESIRAKTHIFYTLPNASTSSRLPTLSQASLLSGTSQRSDARSSLRSRRNGPSWPHAPQEVSRKSSNSTPAETRFIPHKINVAIPTSGLLEEPQISNLKTTVNNLPPSPNIPERTSSRSERSNSVDPTGNETRGSSDSRTSSFLALPSEIDSILTLASKRSSRHGSLFVKGNHDEQHFSISPYRKAMRDLKMRPLDDSSIDLGEKELPASPIPSSYTTPYHSSEVGSSASILGEKAEELSRMGELLGMNEHRNVKNLRFHETKSSSYEADSSTYETDLSTHETNSSTQETGLSFHVRYMDLEHLLELSNRLISEANSYEEYGVQRAPLDTPHASRLLVEMQRAGLLGCRPQYPECEFRERPFVAARLPHFGPPSCFPHPASLQGSYNAFPIDLAPSMADFWIGHSKKAMSKVWPSGGTQWPSWDQSNPGTIRNFWYENEGNPQLKEFVTTSSVKKGLWWERDEWWSESDSPEETWPLASEAPNTADEMSETEGPTPTCTPQVPTTTAEPILSFPPPDLSPPPAGNRSAETPVPHSSIPRPISRAQTRLPVTPSPSPTKKTGTSPVRNTARPKTTPSSSPSKVAKGKQHADNLGNTNSVVVGKGKGKGRQKGGKREVEKGMKWSPVKGKRF